MFLRIKDLNIHYESYGSGPPIVLLHGWCGDGQSFTPLLRALSDRFRVYVIDLPGFGQSHLPTSVWRSKDYAELVQLFLERRHIEKPIVVGHSFGGKIAIQVASNCPIAKLILVGSSGIKPKRRLLYYLKVWPKKMAKKITEKLMPKRISQVVIEFFKKRMGSKDYRQASGIMREILIQSVNEDLRCLLPKITCPTLLIWGDRDKETPLYMGKMMHDLLPNSQFVLLNRAGHYAYIDQFEQFMQWVNAFLSVEE